MTRDLIAYCGLYCGACSFKTAVEEGVAEHVLSMPERYDKFKSEPFGTPCPGCRLENLCGQCGMRDCAAGKELAHCGQCDDFPCEKVQSFNDDGAPHHAEAIANLRLLRELGEERWLELQKEKWTCSCGRRLSWYHKTCSACGK